MFCTQCGNEIRANENFCTSCGAKVNRKKTEFEEVEDFIYEGSMKVGKFAKNVGKDIVEEFKKLK